MPDDPRVPPAAPAGPGDPASPGPGDRSESSVAARLIVALVALMAGVQLAFGWVLGGIQERQLVSRVADGGIQLSQSLAGATWHAMLANHRDAVYAMMGRVAGRNGVERVRLYDNTGRLAHETGEARSAERAETSSEPCVACHDGPAPRLHLPAERRTRIFTTPEGRRRLGVVTGIHNEPSCSGAACHAHPATRSVLGVLEVELDLAPVDEELADLRRRTVIAIAAEMAVLGLAIMFLTSRLVGRPIRRLVGAARGIGRGDLDTPVRVEDPTELGALGAAFEGMRVRLRDSMRETQDARADLERKVEERTRQLKEAEQHLVQSDRLASLGRLAGTVAHEVNNPVSAVLNFSTLMQRMLKDGNVPPGREAEFREYLSHVSTETARVGRIVSELLAFSRRGSPRRAPSDLHAVIERTLSILRHKLEMARVEARFEPGGAMPLVECDASQIEQVVMNLVVNAAEALPPGGHVVVRTRHDPVAVQMVIEVEDDGPGIAEEHLKHIFEPFFSTKEGGKSLGLGLSVAFGIVDSHHGRIEVRSRAGHGTLFRVRLPVRPPAAPAPPPEGGSP